MGTMANGFTQASGFFFKNLYKGLAWAGSFLISAIPMLLTLGVVYGVLVAVAPPLAGAVTIEAILGAFLVSTAGLPALIALPLVGWAVKKLLEDVITPWNDGWYMKLINGAELKQDRPWWSLELSDESKGLKVEKGQEYNYVGQKGYDFGLKFAADVMALPSAFVNAVKDLATLPGKAVAALRTAFTGSKVAVAEEQNKVAPEEVKVAVTAEQQPSKLSFVETFKSITTLPSKAAAAIRSVFASSKVAVVQEQEEVALEELEKPAENGLEALLLQKESIEMQKAELEAKLNNGREALVPEEQPVVSRSPSPLLTVSFTNQAEQETALLKQLGWDRQEENAPKIKSRTPSLTNFQ